MNTHVTDSELSEAVAGVSVDPRIEEHLGSCVACRRRLDEVREILALRRADLEAGAPDWEAQRQRILAQIESPRAVVVPLRRGRWWRPALAAAASLIAAAGLWIGVARHRPAQTAGTLAVEQILSEVDATLADNEVPGFEALDSIVPTSDEIESLISNGAS